MKRVWWSAAVYAAAHFAKELLLSLMISLSLTLLLEETLVVLAEGLCCRGWVKRPWVFALLVNLFSYGMGLLQNLF